MKKCLKTILGILLITLLSACSTVIADNNADYSNQTLTGQITEINGSTITLTLGKVKENESESDAQFPQMSEGMTKPEDDENFDPSQMGEMPEGFDPSQMGERPELGEGEMPEDFDPSQMGEKPEGGMQNGFGRQQTITYTFKAKKGSAVITIGECEVTLADGTDASVSDLQVGDVVAISIDENNTVTSISVYLIADDEQIS